MNKFLYQLDSDFKAYLVLFLTVLTAGVLVGLIYLNFTTDMTPSGTTERWNGSTSDTEMDFEITENYPKSISEMLATTHTHIISFALIFGIVGFIFNYNSIVKGHWKKFLMLEPIISILVTFSSIWLMRFVHQSFVYLVIISAVLMYSSYFIVVGISLYELLFKRVDSG
ncbi:hypothetical protein MNBD_IGNAVI01-1317 [hydrothermal vent metagenome]|uniref:Uncharacterized protein n=1 Tax=hydrothermal vent metagenome TaxID=652676 RepID=A0A3B1CP57_9ZZZZ